MSHKPITAAAASRYIIIDNPPSLDLVHANYTFFIMPLWYYLSLSVYLRRVDVMTLRTARLINKISKVFLASAVLVLILFFAVYIKGDIEFKYISLPVMACFIGITWLGTSKAAIMALEKETMGKETDDAGKA